MIPSTPGVYLFHDSTGKVIYVGKAKNLKKRVASYRKNSKDTKTRVLATKINKVETITVDTEVEALLLENKLIKKYSPRYNINLKDSKTYAYIKLTSEKFPRILSTRQTKGKGTYFGPYTDGTMRRELVRLTVKLFKLRTCKTLPKRPCLNYYIDECTAPCARNVNYQNQVKRAISFLNGNTSSVLSKLKADMRHSSIQQKYEIALQKKRQIESIKLLNEKQKVDLLKTYDQNVLGLVRKGSKVAISVFVISRGVITTKHDYKFDNEANIFESFVKLYYSKHTIPDEIILGHSLSGAIKQYLERLRGKKVKLTQPSRGEKKSLLKLAEKNALLSIESKTLRDLKQKLNLPVTPYVIECFDMSNFGKTHVGALVVFKDQNPVDYRRFKIKSVQGIDDYGAMKETIFRRYSSVNQDKSTSPDLIVIDGGKGHLESALKALKELSLTIPIIALAKQNEEIYIPGEQNPRTFPISSPMMIFLRGMRDTVHSYVLRYNRQRQRMLFREKH